MVTVFINIASDQCSGEHIGKITEPFLPSTLFCLILRQIRVRESAMNCHIQIYTFTPCFCCSPNRNCGHCFYIAFAIGVDWNFRDSGIINCKNPAIHGCTIITSTRCYDGASDLPQSTFVSDPCRFAQNMAAKIITDNIPCFLDDVHTISPYM